MDEPEDSQGVLDSVNGNCEWWMVLVGLVDEQKVVSGVSGWLNGCQWGQWMRDGFSRSGGGNGEMKDGFSMVSG